LSAAHVKGPLQVPGTFAERSRGGRRYVGRSLDELTLRSALKAALVMRHLRLPPRHAAAHRSTQRTAEPAGRCCGGPRVSVECLHVCLGAVRHSDAKRIDQRGEILVVVRGTHALPIVVLYLRQRTR
jgi:hypothetical protein